ncbi:MAG: TspO protein [Candidatus Pelagibacter sp. TMED273]|nr:MAG: TspO protein [Candidatus Pelagibacter sp. TMED273]
MLKNKFLSLIIFAIITFIPSFIGRFATLSSKEPWYSSLNRSSFTPPDWVFAPVWTTLYLFMTIAIWSVWHKNYKNVNIVYLYIVHLFFNTTWSVVFFVFHNILLALINSIIITLFVIFLTFKFKKISELSFYLMIPYLLWSFYALILNFNLVLLN